MDYLKIGKIVNTFGIKGELKVDVYTDFISERFKKNTTVYLGDDYLPVEVNGFKMHKGYLLVQFKGLEDINLVEKYKNMDIYKSSEDIKSLPKGRYYFRDIIGLKVYTDCLVGEVIDMEEGIANNNMRIKKLDGKTVLVPFVSKLIKEVDLDNKTITIVKMEGLI